MKSRTKLLLMCVMIIYPITVSQGLQESSETPTKELTTFSTEYPEYTKILKALSPEEKAAVYTLVVYERDRSMDEAIKIVILEKEPQIEYWKIKAEETNKQLKQERKAGNRWKIATAALCIITAASLITDI